MEYAKRLTKEAEKYAEDLVVLMLVYFEKPRTTVGWKGYINDPFMDDSFRVDIGMEKARQFLLDVAELGPAGDAGEDRQRVAVPLRQQRAADRAHHLVLDVGEADVVQQDRELVAPEPSGGVARAENRAERGARVGFTLPRVPWRDAPAAGTTNQTRSGMLLRYRVTAALVTGGGEPGAGVDGLAYATV